MNTKATAAAMAQSELYVVIPFYHGHDDLHPLLASLAASSLPPSLVVIVDNSLNDSAPLDDGALTQTHSVPTKVIRTEAQIGFGRACNAGALYAMMQGASHVCVINQDTTVHPHMLQELLLHHTRENAMLSAPLQLSPTGHITEFVARLYVPEARKKLRTLVPDELPKSPRLSQQPLSGACLFFHVKLLDQYGLFDPLYTMYGEDRDLGHRLLQHGEKLLLVRSAWFYHRHSNVHAKGSERAKLLRWQAESGAVTYLKHHWRKRDLWRFRAEQLVLFVRTSMLTSLHQGWNGVRAREASMISKSRDLSRARRGESVKVRMLRYVDKDLGAQALLSS